MKNQPQKKIKLQAQVVDKKEKIKSKSVFKPRQVKIRVVGLGGGGCSIVAEMAQNIGSASFILADTDRRIFKRVTNKNKLKVFLFGEKSTGGMGTGMNPELAFEAAQQEKDKIAKIFQGQDLSIIVGALGGGVASGAGPLFSEMAKSQKNITLGIFTLPFAFEGEKKAKIAKKALDQLKKHLSAVIIVPNEKIFQIADRKTALKKSFSYLNQMFALWISGLIDVISKPSLINIDFADLKAILKGSGEELFFNQVESRGASRAEDIIKKILQNSVLESPLNVKRILFNISGGKDLAIKEVEAISRKISSLNEKAKIIFGISQSFQNNGVIKITLLALSGEKEQEVKRLPVASDLKKNNKVKNKKRGILLKKNSAPLKVKTSGIKKENGSGKNLINSYNIANPVLANVFNGVLPKERPRRSGLEAKEEEKQLEEKEWEEGRNWEVPTFLRSRPK